MGEHQSPEEAESRENTQQVTNTETQNPRDAASLTEQDYIADIRETADEIENRAENENTRVPDLVFEFARESLWTTTPDTSAKVLDFDPNTSIEWETLISENEGTDWTNTVQGMAFTIYRQDLKAELRSRSHVN